MDLLFKRYASPFDYLNLLLESGNFESGIVNILEAIDNDKSWEYYLSNNPCNEKSFVDWKKDTQNKTQAQRPMSKVQVVATVEKSQNILKNFKPLNKEK